MTGKEKLVFRYSPKRAIIVDSVVVTIMTALIVFFIKIDIWQMGILAGFILGKSLIELFRASVIEVSYLEPEMIYRRNSLFRNNTVKIPAWNVSGAETRIVSMWKGSIREKLILKADGREFLLIPFYSSGNPLYATVHQDLRSLRQAGEKYLEERTEEAIKQAEEEMERSKIEKTVWSLLEMSVQCPRCEAHVPVNGPYNNFVCAECCENIEITPDNWTDLLEDVRDETAFEIDPGEGSRSSIMGVFNTSLFYGRLEPYCPKCKTDFDMENDYAAGENSVTCSSCGESLSVETPSKWFNKVFKGVTLIVGATGSADSNEQAPEPVIITCPSCSATFETTGKARNTPCPHCENSIFLPDDLWYHFHPVPGKKRWFVGFTARFDPD